MRILMQYNSVVCHVNDKAVATCTQVRCACNSERQHLSSVMWSCGTGIYLHPFWPHCHCPSLPPRPHPQNGLLPHLVGSACRADTDLIHHKYKKTWRKAEHLRLKRFLNSFGCERMLTIALHPSLSPTCSHRSPGRLCKDAGCSARLALDISVRTSRCCSSIVREGRLGPCAHVGQRRLGKV